MTKTPTLGVSTDLLDLEAAPPLPWPSLGFRKERWRLSPALTLDKPWTGYGGAGPDQRTQKRTMKWSLSASSQTSGKVYQIYQIGQF